MELLGAFMDQTSRLFYMPTRIVHGLGSSGGVAGLVRAVGGSKALVCTDKGLTGAGVTERITSSLQEAGLPFALFDDVEEDPGVKTVASGVDVFMAEACDAVIALGGGSPMCAGKGVALVAANGGVLTDYEGFNKAGKPPFPVVAVPTTAGSGTEVSKVTVLTDESRNFKMSILDERTFPSAAILDGGLMESLPSRPALVAGMDALAHALDALWSVGATDFSDGLATTAAAAIFEICRRRRSPVISARSSGCWRRARLPTWRPVLPCRAWPTCCLSPWGGITSPMAWPPASCCRTPWPSTFRWPLTSWRRSPGFSAHPDPIASLQRGFSTASGRSCAPWASLPASTRTWSARRTCRRWWSSAWRWSTTA